MTTGAGGDWIGCWNAPGLGLAPELNPGFGLAQGYGGGEAPN